MARYKTYDLNQTKMIPLLELPRFGGQIDCLNQLGALVSNSMGDT